MTDLPMTVLGGYLGAGKTTLLNRVLAEAHGRRIAVVVNDFGAVNVDADLLRRGGEDTIELSNGCICCNLADGMSQVMQRLRELRDRLDHVVVEVSGVGDPGAVAAWADHPGFRRNGAVVCADVLTVRDLAQDRWVADTVLDQLRAADVVLLTKTDLADAEHTAHVRSWVAELAPGARVFTAAVSVASLLDTQIATRMNVTVASEHAEHLSWSLTGTQPVPLDALETLVGRLPPEVVRVKGVLRTVTAPDRRTVLQVTGGRRAEFRDDGRWEDANAPSTVVVIARPDGRPDQPCPPYIRELQDRLGLYVLDR